MPGKGRKKEQAGKRPERSVQDSEEAGQVPDTMKDSQTSATIPASNVAVLDSGIPSPPPKWSQHADQLLQTIFGRVLTVEDFQDTGIDDAFPGSIDSSETAIAYLYALFKIQDGLFLEEIKQLEMEISEDKVLRRKENDNHLESMARLEGSLAKAKSDSKTARRKEEEMRAEANLEARAAAAELEKSRNECASLRAELELSVANYEAAEKSREKVELEIVALKEAMTRSEKEKENIKIDQDRLRTSLQSLRDKTADANTRTAQAPKEEMSSKDNDSADQKDLISELQQQASIDIKLIQELSGEKIQYKDRIRTLELAMHNYGEIFKDMRIDCIAHAGTTGLEEYEGLNQ